MKYFFILGNHPHISIAEIYSQINNIISPELLNNGCFVFETNDNIDAKNLIKKLGGTIKIGLIEDSTSLYNPEKIFKLTKSLLSPGEGKFKFGISYYGNKKFNTKKLGMRIKSFLKDKKISCRWVISREKTLSSVVVTQNKLCQKGIEIVLLENGKNVLVGKTLAVQAFKELSFRDYNRPARDSKSGMLPPKLAQIMINLSQVTKDEVLLDPFCGSGTVLMENLLMGAKKVIGSDVSEKAVKDTTTNTDWIINKFQLENIDYSVNHKSATEISNLLEKESINAIVTEPYLGPQRGEQKVKEIKTELEKLYSESLSEFKKILKKNGRVVILWPVFTTNKERKITNSKSSKTEAVHITPDYSGFKIVNPIPKKLQDKIDLTHRKTLIYGREGQRVWREIVILEKE